MSPFTNWRHDLPAAVVVFFVAVPLCLGIALASGAPLVSGLIAGIVGGIVVGLISRSAVGVSGPAAGLVVIVVNAVTELGSYELFLVAVMAGGLFQLLLGLVKAGVLGYFFPSSVIKGMLSAIGVIIVLKQIPHAFGHDSDPEGEMSFFQPDGDTPLSALRSMLDDLSPNAILVSATGLAILLLWEHVLSKKHKVFQLIQGPLVVVVAGIAFELVTMAFFPGFALSRDHMVDVPVAGSLPAFVEALPRPDWAGLTNTTVWITGITIAIVASLETLLCVEATDKLDPYRRVTPTNRELVAQGTGNLLSGFLGGLPVTQVIVRSSANLQSGGRTKTSAIVHGVLLLIFAVALPQILNLVPLASLAAILILVGYKLAKPSVFKEMFSRGPDQYVPFLTTVVGIVFTDLLTGILLGMAVAIFVILRAHYLNSHFLHITAKHPNGEPTLITMTLAEEVTFLNKGALAKELNAIPDDTHVRIDGSKAWHIDQDVLEILDSFSATAELRGITVELIGDFERGISTRLSAERAASRSAV